MDNLEQQSKSQLFTLKGQPVEQTPSAGNDSVGNHPDSLQLQDQIIDQKYKIILLLGEGGMGAVYKAHHLMLDKEVALKTFRTPNLTEESWRRFQREAQAIARLSHINIVQVFDFGVSEQNIPYYTMECLSGQSLAERLNKEGGLPIDQTVKIFLQVCQGLGAAHSKGIIHRDLKPANIFLANDGNSPNKSDLVKIVDFGIAGLANESQDSQKLTTVGTIFGSPLYMSPEQSLGGEMTERSDIYSCGCALFEALTGSPPYVGNNALATMLKHQNSPIPKLDDIATDQQFPQRLNALIHKMLAKSESKRFQTFDQVAAELEEIARAVGSRTQGKSEGPGQSPGGEEPARSDEFEHPPSDRAQTLVVATTIAILISLGSLAYFFWPRPIPTMKAETTVTPPAVQGLDKQKDALQPAHTVLTAGPKTIAKIDGGPVKRFLRNPQADGKKEKLQFVFPDGQSLGTLTWRITVDKLLHSAPARGVVSVPPHWTLGLDADEEVSKKPELLKGFGPDDLPELNLSSNGQFNDSHIVQIGRLTGIRLLDIGDAEVSDRGIEDLNKLTKLLYFSVEDATKSGKALPKLRRLRVLERLTIFHDEFLSDLLQKTRNSTSMTLLRIENCHLTNRGLIDIATMPNLINLFLKENSGITDSGVEALGSLQHLDKLDLSKTAVTAGCVSHLQNFQTLKELWIDCSEWSKGDRARLKAALPKCTIHAGNDDLIDDAKRTLQGGLGQ